MSDSIDHMSPAGRAIAEAVAKSYGVHPSKICSKGKRQSVAAARAIAIYVCRLDLGMSLNELCEDFAMTRNGVCLAVERVKDRLLAGDARWIAASNAGAAAVNQFMGKPATAAE